MRTLKAAAGLARSFVVYYGQVWRNAGRRRFYGEFLREGDLAFDVGAHVGDRVRTWRQLGARVIAVEPQPALTAVLRRLYGKDSGVIIEPRALGATPGTATLHVSTASPTLATLSAGWVEQAQHEPRFRDVTWDRAVQVEVTTLDALIATHGAPRFCKIDVEGFEFDVLRGLTQPLPALSFEYLTETKQQVQACVNYVASLGAYRFRSSSVETMKWSQPRWLSAQEMCEWLDKLTLRDGSGDVYAQLP